MTAAPAVSVFAVDEQESPPVDTRRWAGLAERVLVAQGVRRPSELSVLFVDVSAMADLNREHMGADGPTDVLAFPIDDPVERGRWPDGGTSGPDRDAPDPDDLPILLGDVVICPAVAAGQVAEHAGSPQYPAHDGSLDDELALLVVHGVLHVLGMDHADEQEAAAMWARQSHLLDTLHRSPS